MTNFHKSMKGFNPDTVEGSTEGTDVWNIAKGFTTIKVLRLLVLLDRHETIAKFGFEDSNPEEMDNPDENSINKKRIEGINRFIFTLDQLIGNVKFALKKEDKKIMIEFEERIRNVQEVLDGIYDEKENAITHEKIISMNEDHFGNCLKTLKKIKDDLNTPINKAGLIFRTSDELDIDAIMHEIIEGG